MTTAAGLTPFERMYELALNVTFRQDQPVAEWADYARTMAEELCAKLGVPGGEGALPTMPGQPPGVAALTPQGVAGSRFGPAFAGWDDTCLQRILFGAQQHALGVQAGGTPDQLKQVEDEIMAAVRELGAIHQQAAAARRAAAQG